MAVRAVAARGINYPSYFPEQAVKYNCSRRIRVEEKLITHHELGYINQTSTLFP